MSGGLKKKLIRKTEVQALAKTKRETVIPSFYTITEGSPTKVEDREGGQGRERETQ